MKCLPQKEGLLAQAAGAEKALQIKKVCSL